MLPSSVVAVAQDPGGAEALAPVVRRLRAEGNHPVSILARRQATDVFARAGLEAVDSDQAWPMRDGSAVDFALNWLGGHKPQLVLTGTSLSADWERGFIRAARRRKVTCLTVLDSWTNYRIRFVEPGETALSPEAIPDRLTVMDDFCAEELTGSGFPSDRLRVVGHPAFDESLVWYRSEAAKKARERLRAEWNVPDGELLATFFSQPLQEATGPPGSSRYRGYDEWDALRASEEALALLRRPVTLVIKPHPKESSHKFREHQRANGVPVVQVANGASADTLIAASDLVVGMTSICLVKAAAAGRRVLSIQPNLRGRDPFILSRMGLLQTVTEKSRLPQAIEALVSNPDPPQLPLPPVWTDGRATDRVVKAIEELLQ